MAESDETAGLYMDESSQHISAYDYVLKRECIAVGEASQDSAAKLSQEGWHCHGEAAAQLPTLARGGL